MCVRACVRACARVRAYVCVCVCVFLLFLFSFVVALLKNQINRYALLGVSRQVLPSHNCFIIQRSDPRCLNFLS